MARQAGHWALFTSYRTPGSARVWVEIGWMTSDSENDADWCLWCGRFAVVRPFSGRRRWRLSSGRALFLPVTAGRHFHTHCRCLRPQTRFSRSFPPEAPGKYDSWTTPQRQNDSIFPFTTHVSEEKRVSNCHLIKICQYALDLQSSLPPPHLPDVKTQM